MPGKTAEDSLSIWAPAISTGDGVPKFWLQPGLEVVVAGIWGVNQAIKDGSID